MEIKIRLQTVVIKDQNMGEVYKVKTLRSAKEIIASKIEETVCEANTNK